DLGGQQPAASSRWPTAAWAAAPPRRRSGRESPPKIAGNIDAPAGQCPRGVTRSRSGGVSADPQAATALEGAPLLFAHPAPDAGVLAGVERPLEALLGRRAAPADRLRLLDLQQGRT